MQLHERGTALGGFYEEIFQFHCAFGNTDFSLQRPVVQCAKPEDKDRSGKGKGCSNSDESVGKQRGGIFFRNAFRPVSGPVVHRFNDCHFRRLSVSQRKIHSVRLEQSFHKRKFRDFGLSIRRAGKEKSVLQVRNRYVHVLLPFIDGRKPDQG